MLTIPADLARRYGVLLDQRGVLPDHRPHFKKWLRFYLDFCHKYTFEPTDRKSLPHFDSKLHEKAGRLDAASGAAGSLAVLRVDPGARSRRIHPGSDTPFGRSRR